MNTKEDKIIFIVGSERSGSTLLRLMLNSHPRIQVFSDAHQVVLEEIESGKRKDYVQPVVARTLGEARKIYKELMSMSISGSDKVKKFISKKQEISF